MPPPLPVAIQPPNFRTPWFNAEHQIDQEWKRFLLSSQTAINALLQFTQHIGGNQGFLGFDDADTGEPAFFTSVVTPPTPPTTAVNPTGLVGLWDDTSDEPLTSTPPGGLSGIGGPFTPGSVIFAGPSGALAQNNPKWFWKDDASHPLLGIGTATPVNNQVVGLGLSYVTIDITDSSLSALTFHISGGNTFEGSILTTGGGLVINALGAATAAGNNQITFATTDVNSSYVFKPRWIMDSNGMFIANNDNAYDIGKSVANRPRTAYIATSIVDPLLIGGVSATQSLTLQTTSGVGTTDALIFLRGNNGATESGRFDSNGLKVTSGTVGIATAPISQAAMTMAAAITAAGGSGYQLRLQGSLTAAANNDSLYGGYINPSYANGGFTGTTFYGLNITDVTNGATNYALFTGAGLVRFGDKLTVLAGGAGIAAWNPSVSTDPDYFVFRTTNRVFFGVESSVGNAVGSIALPFAAVLLTESAFPIEFGTNNTTRWIIGSTGGLSSDATDPGANHIRVNGGALRVVPVAFASLPASPLEGMIATVNNSNTAVWGATIAGGGTNHVLAYYDGTNWTVAAV